MILAAGLGTRLKPITNSIPKALVEVDGVPMIQRVIQNLSRQGFDSIVVNVHHFAHQIREFLKKNNNFGIDIAISDECDELLDTGGGIVKASSLLFDDDANSKDEPVLVHNVDILSNADFRDMKRVFRNEAETGLLLVSDRDSSRKLLFDESNLLKGWHDLKNNKFRPENFTPENDYREFAFSGLYILNKSHVEEMKNLLGNGKYSVMDYFLHPRRERPLKGYFQSGLMLLDIGKPATLTQASEILNTF